MTWLLFLMFLNPNKEEKEIKLYGIVGKLESKDRNLDIKKLKLLDTKQIPITTKTFFTKKMIYNLNNGTYKLDINKNDSLKYFIEKLQEFNQKEKIC